MLYFREKQNGQGFALRGRFKIWELAKDYGVSRRGPQKGSDEGKEADSVRVGLVRFRD